MKGSDIAGERFGRLTAIRFAGRRTVGITRQYKYDWRCICVCGKKVTVASCELRSGHTKSCGCLWRERVKETVTKHGYSRGKLPEYVVWLGMRRRCDNPSHVGYKNYGARGIAVCKRWDDFTLFLKDMGFRPTPKHTIDRKNNNGNYEPKNCRWATRIEQAANSRRWPK